MTEFRKYGRSPLPGRVKLKHREVGEFYVEDGDISAAGLFLKTRQSSAISVGDELAVELPNSAIAPLRGTRMRVVRVTTEGLGLMFL